MRVVLDTNVYISAGIAPFGPTAEILEHLRQRHFALFLSDAIMQELNGVFRRERIIRALRRSPEWVDELLADLRQMGTFVEPATVKAVPSDPTDDLIIGTAITANCDYLVSGNRHVYELGSCQGVQCVTPRQFLLILRQTV